MDELTVPSDEAGARSATDAPPDGASAVAALAGSARTARSPPLARHGLVALDGAAALVGGLVLAAVLGLIVDLPARSCSE